MSSINRLGRHMLLSLGAFLVLVIAGSVSVGAMCFPASSHVSANFGCNVGLFSPVIGAVIAGLVLGRRVSIAMSPVAILVPIVGLGLLFSTEHLRYWFGQDITAALQLAAIYCLLPCAIAAAISATVFPKRDANAL